MSTYPDGLERCGITREQYDAQRKWREAQTPVEVRFEGGPSALREVLLASGKQGEIIWHSPQSWTRLHDNRKPRRIVITIFGRRYELHMPSVERMS